MADVLQDSDDEAAAMQDTHRTGTADEALAKMHEIVDIFLARPDSGPFREPVDWRGLELYDYPEIVKTPMDLGTVKRNLERQSYECAAAVAYDIKLIWKNCQKYNAEGSEFWILAKSFLRRFEDLYRKVRYEHEVGEMPPSPVASGEEEEEDDAEMDEEEDSSEDEEDEDPTNEDEDAEEEDDASKAATAASETTPKKTKRVKQKVEPKKLDPKAQLAANLHLLDAPHLGSVITMLQKECPAALEYIHGQTEEEQVEIMLEKLENTETFQKVSDFCEQHAVKRRGTPLIEEAMRRMHTDPAELLPSDHVEEPTVESSKGTKRGRPRTDNRDIQQIDAKTGDVVNVFASLSAAGNAVGFSRHIVASILRKKYKAKSYQGWTFKYVGGEPDGYEEDPSSKSKGKKRKKSKQAVRAALASPRAIAVAELDAATGQTIRVHPSLTKASKVSGANRHVITKVLSGEIPSWQGLQWRYCDAESGDPIEMPVTGKEEKEES